MTAKWADRFTWDGIFVLQGIAKCDNCQRTSMGVVTAGAPSGNEDLTDFIRRPAGEFTWYPRSGSSPVFEDVPAHIAAGASEAHSTLSIGARMSAILMARTVVEATAKEKGILTGRLFEKIDQLAAAGFIRPDTKEAAHEIRHFGNDMAHGDIADIPDAEEAGEVLDLMDELLNEVFQGPAKTARIKAKRAQTT